MIKVIFFLLKDYIAQWAIGEAILLLEFNYWKDYYNCTGSNKEMEYSIYNEHLLRMTVIYIENYVKIRFMVLLCI